MAQISPSVCRRYLLAGRIPQGGCLRRSLLRPYDYHRVKHLHITADSPAAHESDPFLAGLTDAIQETKVRKRKLTKAELDEWELTVGIEIHAQLNTARKLFSSAATTINDEPNNHVALFDLAMPGSQPIFQKETLIPAIRGALALNCNIQNVSRFDRKHYFHWDQPAGYQLTQYYQPFAKDGYLTLHAHDGIAAEDGESVRIGIKQIQMEQDTAKTLSQPGNVHLLDFNRVGIPLIEIITLPHIHHPSTAAALVRKVQNLLNTVDACVLGMEFGGLRADVNVSVCKRGSIGHGEYAGIKGLGQRTEIKNLSSFKSVEDAIMAERDRQILLLEDGQSIVGETRGWAIGSTDTRRLRGKEGEVDYRYMPDPDLGPVIFDTALVNHLGSTMGIMPDDELSSLRGEYGLTTKDAMSLMALNDGGRVEYFRNVVDELLRLQPEGDRTVLVRLCNNWVLHEMGGLAMDTASELNPLRITREGGCIIPARKLAELITLINRKKITMRTAKKVLNMMFDIPHNTLGSVTEIIDEQGLWFQPMTEQGYDVLAREINDGKVMKEILAGKEGKKKYLVGQMMRTDRDGRLDPLEAQKAVDRLVEECRRQMT